MTHQDTVFPHCRAACWRRPCCHALAGYSDNFEGARELTRTNGAVFVKVGYAWLF